MILAIVWRVVLEDEDIERDIKTKTGFLKANNFTQIIFKVF